VLEAFAQFDVEGTGLMHADHLHTLLVQLHIPLAEAIPDAQPRLQHLREHLLTMPGSYRAPKATAGAAAAADTAADTAAGAGIAAGAAAAAVGSSMRATTAAGAAATALLPRVSMKATSAQSKSPPRQLVDTADTTTAAAAHNGDNSTDMLSDVDGDVSLITVISVTAGGTAVDGSSSKRMRSRVSRRYPASGIGSRIRGTLHASTLSTSQNGAIVQQQGRTATGRSSVVLATAIGTSDYVSEDTASATAVKKQDRAIAASAALTHGDSTVDKIR
jgi:trimeric autotransporter adhesin